MTFSCLRMVMRSRMGSGRVLMDLYTPYCALWTVVGRKVVEEVEV